MFHIRQTWRVKLKQMPHMMHKQHAILQYFKLGPCDAVLTKVVYIYSYYRTNNALMQSYGRVLLRQYTLPYQSVVAQINLLCRSPLQFVLFETRRRNSQWVMIYDRVSAIFEDVWLYPSHRFSAFGDTKTAQSDEDSFQIPGTDKNLGFCSQTPGYILNFN